MSKQKQNVSKKSKTEKYFKVTKSILLIIGMKNDKMMIKFTNCTPSGKIMTTTCLIIY